ncbi:MAG: alpha-N-acetylglucosaminidase, partial [Verrucomicrobiaceae bacterium]
MHLPTPIRTLHVLAIAFFAAASSCIAADDVAAFAGLTRRLLAGQAAQVKGELLQGTGGGDRFELENVGKDLVVRGNNANSMAVGLNHYLRYYCKTNISWYANNPVQVPKVLPTLADKVTRSARCENRFFLNYCTFGYTMPWWQWRDWERLIDWMALNGVTMPLAITGQEAIWYKIWSDLGL